MSEKHSASTATSTTPLNVRVDNLSEPVFCAEKDNVALNFTHDAVRNFRIQAIHPAFIGTIVADRWAPDFAECDMSSDPVFAAEPKRVTFFETPDLWLTGYTYPSFWRPNTVPVRVGDTLIEGLHLVQLWVRHQERAEEVFVVYPPDGYCRARPLPPPHLRWTAYGSSFLVGPVETQIRPIVALKGISFDPAARSFTFEFDRGGSATLALTSLDSDRIIFDVSLNGQTDGLPFAALRSMYTMEINCDVAHVAWHSTTDKGWNEAPIMAFQGGSASELWAGRKIASRHNTSAPDMVFSKFRS